MANISSIAKKIIGSLLSQMNNAYKIGGANAPDTLVIPKTHPAATSLY
jgi:hypothetical protein